MVTGLHPHPVDCLIVGGGPAGLTAAIYLARFHLSVRLVDGGRSRAALIPLTRNHAGFPDGISGVDLLDRMKAQALRYGAAAHRAEVTAIAAHEAGFAVSFGVEPLIARSVLLATGVVNRRPQMPDDAHAEALRRGLLRYCPICDGYEVTDRRVAVLGTGDRGFNETMFLRGYTSDLTLIAPTGAHQLTKDQRADLAGAGVTLVAGAPTSIEPFESRIEIVSNGYRLAFDSLYPALGSDINSALAASLGATVSDEGCLVVDAHQRTDIPGLYAAGDVVLGLDQISHAMGEGGVAATTIRNDLARSHPRLRAFRRDGLYAGGATDGVHSRCEG